VTDRRVATGEIPDMNEPERALMVLLDSVEATAYRRLFAAAPPELASVLGLATYKIAGATLLVAPGIRTAMFNRVIGLGNDGVVSDADIDAISNVYRSAGIKDWWIHLIPSAMPRTLPEQLAMRGFTRPDRKSWAKVLRGTEPPSPVETALQVRRVRAGEEEILSSVLATVFEMPQDWIPWFARLLSQLHWCAYVALDDERIVGGGLLHLQGKNAWLGVGGVLPEARRHGAHRALMTRRIQEAIDARCQRIVTETGEPIADEPNPSLRNMAVCGFRKVCSRQNFAAPV
jgi:GNAT superfamily N-acetyltransferase